MPGVSLSDEGRAQADRLAMTFAPGRLQCVVSSPLERAQETATPIAAAQGLSVETDEGLNEIEFGDWTGLGFDALHGRPDWQVWNRLRSHASPPGGESMVAAQGRALLALSRLRQRFPDGELVAVTHSDIVKAVVAHALGLSIDLMQRIDIDPASRSTATFFGGDLRVRYVNHPVAGP